MGVAQAEITKTKISATTNRRRNGCPKIAGKLSLSCIQAQRSFLPENLLGRAVDVNIVKLMVCKSVEHAAST
jgi:hypothetical protein